jgi:aspartyl-tRNA(Asn)/glutamyl-tRNA(Gln) amidotransferase subunit A
MVLMDDMPTGDIAVNEFVRLSASELKCLYRAGEVSPVEVTTAILNHVDAVNPRVNAVVTVADALALRQAKSAERAYRRGGDGLLLGIPVSVKDTIATRGIRTTHGSLLHESDVPDSDAPVVERLHAAGAVVFGKTNTPEFGWKGETSNRVFGTSRNPWDLECTPGGSSGGAAAAVACGIGPVAVGSDAAGSTRLPAAFCGVVGLKASFGRIPIVPRGALETLSHVGILARTVGDAALVLEAVAGPDPRDRFSLSDETGSYVEAAESRGLPLRIAWTGDLGFVTVNPEIQTICEAGLASFADAGWAVEEVAADVPDPYDVIHVLFCSGLAGARRDDYASVSAQLDPGCRDLVDKGLRLTGADCGAAIIRGAEWQEKWLTLVDAYDLVVTPTVPLAPFAAGLDGPPSGAEGRAGLSWTPFTYPFNLTGQPAISVPCGFTSQGLPVGLQIIGRSRDDVSVLRAAAVIENALPWRDYWPPITKSARRG